MINHEKLKESLIQYKAKIPFMIHVVYHCNYRGIYKYEKKNTN